MEETLSILIREAIMHRGANISLYKDDAGEFTINIVGGEEETWVSSLVDDNMNIATELTVCIVAYLT